METTLSVKIDPRWEIDDVSFGFEPADANVEVLVTSPEPAGPVAVTWGGGEALALEHKLVTRRTSILRAESALYRALGWKVPAQAEDRLVR